MSSGRTHPPARGVYCPLPRRLLVMLYDAVVMLGLLMLAALAALPFGDPEKVAFRDVWFTLWLVAVCFAYLGSCWRYGGMTLGMRAWRVRVAGADGGPVSWPRCLLRFLCGIVATGCGIGILWAAYDRKERAWHDLAANTVLLRTDLPADSDRPSQHRDGREGQ